MEHPFTFAGLMEWLFSTEASRTGLCPCACHISGIYGGTPCPTFQRCAAKFDGCHSCGCPGTACVLGECYTNSGNRVVSPKFDLREIVRWKKQPSKTARIWEIHFGLYTVELLAPLLYAGLDVGHRLNVKFAEAEDWLERICPHDRLNEDGICRACGEDRRGI